MFVYRSCIINSTTTINNVQIILKLLNDSEELTQNQTTKTTILIVLNEIISILFSDDASSVNNALEGLYITHFL